MGDDIHKPYEVDIFDNEGNCIGTKPWPTVDRKNDILPNAFVFVFTPDHEMLLGKITEDYLSKKIYKGKLGAPAVTLIRHGEPCEKAARRALLNDLTIHSPKLNYLGEQFETFSDGTKRKMCTFFCIHDQNLKLNSQVIDSVRTIRRVELETLLRLSPEQFSPQFVRSYERNKRHFPF